MKFKYIIFLITLILLSSKNTHSAKSTDPRIVRVIDLIFKEKFHQAAAALDTLIAQSPANPAGYFYYGVIYWRESALAPDFDSYDKKMKHWLERCRDVADSILARNKLDTNAWFYLGGAHGFLGSMYARKGKWLKTGYHAWKGTSALEKTLELDPEMYDVYYGLGLYHVMAGHQGAIVRFIQKLLPIPNGDAKRGLAALQTAVKKGRYTELPAQSALVFAWLYFENDYRKALETLAPLLGKYPGNTDLLCMQINALFYLELNQPQQRGSEILNYVNQLEKVISRRNLKTNVWWQQKLIFLKGFAHYLLENDEAAVMLLGKYSDSTRQQGRSYLTALADLILGKIYDFQGQRVRAREKYKKAADAEQFGNVRELAKQLLKERDLSRELTIQANVTGFPERP